jgi:glucose uptake protein
MILPSSYYVTLALVVLGMVCWGCWANFLKASGKWRFELFYFDFAVGMLIASLIGAFTFGTLGFDGFSFYDDLLHAAKRQDVLGVLAGFVFNLGNMLLVASVAEAGMTVAFAVGIGVAIVVGSVWSFFLMPGENAVLLFIGAGIVLLAVVLCSTAYRLYKLSKVDELVRTGKQKSTRKLVSLKGVTIAAFGGLLFGCYLPLISRAMEGDAGVGPYSIGVMFAIGVFVSTFFYNLFFMNLPVSGPPVEILEYVRGTLRQHVMGLLAGVVWFIGFGTTFVAAAAESTAVVSPAISYSLQQGGMLIAVLCGLLYWKEFNGADGRVRSLLFIMLTLFICGIGLVAVAPVWTRG